MTSHDIHTPDETDRGEPREQTNISPLNLTRNPNKISSGNTNNWQRDKQEPKE